LSIFCVTAETRQSFGEVSCCGRETAALAEILEIVVSGFLVAASAVSKRGGSDKVFL
jgi:hypothetical protein